MTVLVETFGDVQPDAGFAAELGPVSTASPERRREYATVRACARRALRILGRGPAPILTDPDGVPLWPHDVVGSLTHCPGYRAAVVADARRVVALGVDAEPHQALPDDVMDLVVRPEELRPLRAFAAEHRVRHVDRIAFSAKESAYKAWFPTTRRFLEFTDITITLRIDDTFIAHGPAGTLPGRWAIRRGFVVTLAVLDGRQVAPC